MTNKLLIREIHLQNILSYADTTVELGPLNIVIGANGSGKSNLIEAFRILQAAPRDLTHPIRTGGGAGEWVHKSTARQSSARIETIVDYPQGIKTPQGVMSLRYAIEFASVQQRLDVLDEFVENEQRIGNEKDVYFFYRYLRGNPMLNLKLSETSNGKAYSDRSQRRLPREDLSPEQSVLSQRKDDYIYPEIAYLAKQFENIHIFSDWDVSRTGNLRQAQKADGRIDFLDESGENLALILNDLINQGLRSQLVKDLQQFFALVSDITVKIANSTIQLFIHEQDSVTIPSTRLSDGMIRFLCLLAILRHPNPPPLICIEEPELGMHPDAMSVIAELLQDAATRTQIILTTHSDALISSLTSPETVFVCERDKEGSTLRRLESEKLQSWLENYSLGDLWRMGELGGTRW